MTDNSEDFKKKREQYTIQIRKNHRQQIFNKRRNIIEINNHDQQSQSINQNKAILIVDSRYYQRIEILINQQYTDSMFQQLAQNINDGDIMLQHRGVIGMRKLLARNVDPPIKRFIDKGLTNKCIWLAKQKQYPHIKMEAAWILTNVASGQSSFCQRLVERGGIDLFINLLRQNQKGIVDQAIWGIGNLAADKVKFRDQILKKGGMGDLIKIVQNTKDKLIIRNGAWAVTNLCRGLPHPDTKYIKQALPLLCKVIKTGALKTSNNKQVLSDVIWAICHMTQSSKPRIQKVSQADILPQIFKYAVDNYSQIYVPALKILGNFSSGNENHTDQLIKHGIFQLAIKILDHPKKPIRKQMCWALSNIAAGVQGQVQKMMQHIDLMNKIGTHFHQDNLQVKRQICWLYANMGLLGNRIKVIQFYIHYDIVRVFVNLLSQQDSQTLEHVLETLFKILFIGKKCLVDDKNIILEKFLQYGGGQRLQDLQMHQNPNVYELTVKILKKYFDLETNVI